MEMFCSRYFQVSIIFASAEVVKIYNKMAVKVKILIKFLLFTMYVSNLWEQAKKCICWQKRKIIANVSIRNKT